MAIDELTDDAVETAILSYKVELERSGKFRESVQAAWRRLAEIAVEGFYGGRFRKELAKDRLRRGLQKTVWVLCGTAVFLANIAAIVAIVG